MKRLLALLLAAAMVLALAACGGGSTNSQSGTSTDAGSTQTEAPATTQATAAPAPTAAQPETPADTDATESTDEITLDVIICQYGPNTQDWFLGSGMNGTNFVEKFESENPGVKLNLEVVSWNDVYTVVDTRIANNNAPDILNIDVFANYAAEDLLLPVQDYCPDVLYADFFPSFIDQSVMDGTVWAVPDLASARALFYNVDLLEEAGVEVPTTWAELEDVSQAIIDYYDGEIYPWGIDMTTDEGQAAFAYYTWGNGGGFVDRNGNWNVNSPENVEAVNFAVSLVDQGFTNPNPATQTRYDLQDMFAAGKLAMVIAPNQLPTYVADKDGDINMATAALPANEGKTGSSVGVMDRIMAFKDDSAPDQEARNEAIGKFLTFFYDPENYVGWVSMEGFLPAVNSAVEFLVAADPTFDAWLEVLDGCQFYPTAKAEWDQVKQGVITVEQNALSGADVQAELDALQEQLEAAVEANGGAASVETESEPESEPLTLPEGEEVTLDVIICQYGPNTQDWFLGSGMDGTNFVDKFEAENPGVKLNLEVVSWNDVYTVVDTRIANNNAPDILNIDVFANYATEGLLLPVKDYCPDDLYADFFPSFIDQSLIDGTVWAVPDLASARALFYNVDLLEEAGVEVPTTWTELEDVSQAIIDYYDGEIYPWGIDMTTDEGQAAFAYYTWGNGGGFVDGNGDWNVNSPENVEAINYAIGLVDQGFTNPNPATQTRYDLQDMFAAGKLAMLIAPNQLPTYVADKDGDINMATAALPANEGKTGSSVGVMDRVMAFKDDSAENQEARNTAIAMFLKFFYDPENYVGWVSMEGFLPAVNSAVEALVDADPNFEAWLEVLDGCQFYPTAKAEWDQVKQGVIAVEQNALSGADVQAELDALQAQLEAAANAQ